MYRGRLRGPPLRPSPSTLIYPESPETDKSRLSSVLGTRLSRLSRLSRLAHLAHVAHGWLTDGSRMASPSTLIYPESPGSLGYLSAEYPVTGYVSQQLSRFIHHSPITHIRYGYKVSSESRPVGCSRPTSDSSAFCRLYHEQIVLHPSPAPHLHHPQHHEGVPGLGFCRDSACG